ncbi:MAG: hypothetical protein ACI81L_003370 [Verrucomicrobiales bacterium]|jgi:hypothetical protein
MAAPEYVPSAPTTAKHYTSPPQRAGAWSANRPGETFAADNSSGPRLGAQGPDQGFALTLTRVFDTKIELADGEHRSDVDAGCVGVATKRASMFRRAPVVHDLRIAYTLFGFLDDTPVEDLVEFRKSAFAEVHYSFHYFECRAIADLVTNDVLAQTPDEVDTRYRADWRDQLGQ